MKMKRTGRIHYIAADFNGSPCSIQGFTTRHEGISRPPYNSLNTHCLKNGSKNL